MNNDSFTDISRENWFSRMGSSLTGIFFGIVLFIAAFPLLWWNEGHSVERYDSLNEGQELVISVSSELIDLENNGQLIHTQGLASSQDVLKDEVFNVSATAIKLVRHISMYQWNEHKTTETTEKIGGTKETKTTYTYEKEWSNHQIESSQFKRLGHTNPTLPFPYKTWKAKNVTVGHFKLNPSQINRITQKSTLSLHSFTAPKTLADKKVAIMGDHFYLGTSEGDPAIGDMKIHFQMVSPMEITVMAQQKGDSFIAYETKAGSPIDFLKSGNIEAKTLFTLAHEENTIMTWALRIAGLLLMWGGLSLILQPLAMLANVVPLLGNIVEIGTKILAFLITIPCAFITIAIAWIAYRPLLAGGLIVVSVLALIAIKLMSHKNTPKEVPVTSY
ncbi:MAG: TMEM43 family protein [Methylococcales bacterium]|nr:TMEM43 family protein [Methylococcales bacterium]MCK5924818.1 TMEM43 family protein [Methylococcales bacterium]